MIKYFFLYLYNIGVKIYDFLWSFDIYNFLFKYIVNFYDRFLKEYIILGKNTFKKILFPFGRPYFLLFFLVTLLTAFPILISWKMEHIVKLIGEPHYSILSFSVVIIVTSGLYIIAEEFHGITKNKASEKEVINDYNENGNLFWGFISLIMPIFFMLIVLSLVSLQIWDNYRKPISILVFIFSLCIWILANGNIGGKFKTMQDIKAEGVDKIKEKTIEAKYNTGNYGFTNNV